jgi:NADH:ubiquinone oxidoreductase subunit 5 (subunit L)/multisubunit Na+/H+ antiporter MnhA subunit
MLIVVNSISFLVHIYTTKYLENDAHLNRFISYIALFTSSMLIPILGDNLFVLFLGWEGAGLCSHSLISFRYTRVQANKSALKAVIVNRISDFGLTLGIICIFYYISMIDFTSIFAITTFFGKYSIFLTTLTLNCYIITLISLLLFSGAVGKSAQIFSHT